MSRFDKYDPVSGGFRAPLLAAITSADIGKIQGVSINTSGQVVIGGSAETAIEGVICAHKAFAAGDIIDVMTAGEIVEATYTVGTAFTAGAAAFVTGTTGVVNITSGAGTKKIGRMVELNRMIVRVPPATIL